MRKSFTWLGSFLVIMLLSFQMALAAPTIATNGLNPADNGKINPDFSVFTMTFKGAVSPGEGQIIGLFNSSNTEDKAIQLRAIDKTVDGSVITYNHEDGIVVFNGSVVTIQFKGVSWIEGENYWITFGASAIKDGSGSFAMTSTGDNDNKWEFTVNDKTAPVYTRLTPKDDATKVPTNQLFSVKFKEKVRFVDGTSYSQMLEDFAIYTSTFGGTVNPQEGGDLVSVRKPKITLYDGGAAVSVATHTQFDSITIQFVNGGGFTTGIAALPSSTNLYLRIKPGVLEDLSDNAFAGINNETLWNITTKDGDFKAPVITSESTPLASDDEFYIDLDPDNVETVYVGTTGTLIANGQDLKSLVSVKDKNGDAVEIKTAKITTGDDKITIVLTNVMSSSLAPYTVSIAAGAVKDASDNPSKAASKTFGAGNWDAPQLISAKVVNNGGTTMDFLVTANEKSVVHYVVVRADKKTAPTLENVFGNAKDAAAITTDKIVDNAIDKTDVYYRVTSATAGVPTPTVVLPAQLGSLGQFYGKQTKTGSSPEFSIDEIFAEGDIYIPYGNFEVLKRITGLPASHGSNYEIYFALVDDYDTDGKYDTKFYTSTTEHVSDLKVVTANVSTIDILMPEAWFDGDSTTVNPGAHGNGLMNDAKAKPVNVNSGVGNNGDALVNLKRDGKIYINFNEAVRKNNGAPLTAADLKASLFVVQQAVAGAPGDLDADDTGWTGATQFSYTAALSADGKQIIITPNVSWASQAHVWVKIRNSKIEDGVGNEIVPYGNLYTQEFIVEDYVAPIVRYSYNGNYDATGAWNPVAMDSMINVPFQNYVDGEYKTAEITVTISEKIYVFPGAFEDGTPLAGEDLIEFTNDPDDKAYIGKFFKIRKGDGSTVNQNSSDPLEKEDFEFTIDYNYGDSTLIHIKPKAAYDSEVWYFVEMEPRIQDVNRQTLGDGALVPFADRPFGFGSNGTTYNYAPTGNATVTGWDRYGVYNAISNPDENNNITLVFKSEDNRNPELTFFSYKNETDNAGVLNALPLDDIDGATNIALGDTIGVYIDEYVALGFDHYFKFDELTNKFVLDANAMRRYFKLYDTDNDKMLSFDIVGLDTTRLLNDTLIFYIDPYYVDADGEAIPNSESANFEASTSYRIYFNSIDDDDQGVHDVSGKTKGIYWDDNSNLVLATWADFSTVSTATHCISSVISPVPGSTNLDPSTISYITVSFDYPALAWTGPGVPNAIQVTEGTSSTTSIQGQFAPGTNNIVRYPVTFVGDSTYTIRLGASYGGEIHLNSGMTDADLYPSESCLDSKSDFAKPDTIWTLSMMDKTKPVLDSLNATGIIGTMGYTAFTMPVDDSEGFDKTGNMVMVFTEEVNLVSGKRLTIYDSSNKTVAVVYAQNCTYGVKDDPSKADPSYTLEDKRVVVIPAAYFGSYLKYTTKYHVIVDAGFVTDKSGNQWVGIHTEDLDTFSDDGNDLADDWAFMTGSDPAPYIVKYVQKNALASLTDISIQFSEAVVATGAVGTNQISIYEVSSGATLFEPVDEFKSNDVNRITPSADKKVWTIKGANLDIPFEYGKQYAIVVPAGAFKDGNGAILTNSTDTVGVTYAADPVTDSDQSVVGAPGIWYVNFTDAVAPYAMNYWPRNNAMHVPYNAYLYIEFNEPVHLTDGSAIIPDPNADFIDGFISVSNNLTGALSAAAGEFNVEFVGNDKQLIRITVLDPDGYNYEVSSQSTMQTAAEYTVTIVGTAGGYTIEDANGNDMTASTTFTFTTEDIIAPVINSMTVGALNCDNEMALSIDITEASDTARIYYAVMPEYTNNKPSASSIFAQNVTNAIKVGVLGANEGTNNYTIKLGSDFIEDPQFRVFAVTKDLEYDIWTPVSAAWDSLFFFDGYGEGYDRIRDMMPSANVNDTVKQSGTFRVWDNDAPYLKANASLKRPATYPATGTVQFPVGDSIAFWFSEAVVEGSVGFSDTITLRRYDNNIAVAAMVEFKPTVDSSLVITPLADLDQETTYYVEFDRYAIQDTAGVCPTGAAVYYPEMVGRGFYFTTEDNIGPRYVSVSPYNTESCVFCPDLNANGDEVIKVTFYDHNELKINPKSTDPYVYLYTGSSAVAWDVIPASLITFAQGKNDTTWVATIPLAHEFYASDLITAKIPAGLISDKFGNVATVGGSSTVDIDWSFTTCNNGPIPVKTEIASIDPFFNFSEVTSSDNGLDAAWSTWKTNIATGTTGLANVPTHITLKVDFSEDVQLKVGDNWKLINDVSVSDKLILDNLKLTDSKNHIKAVFNSNGTINTDKSNIVIIARTSSSVTLALNYAKDASFKLPIYDLLDEVPDANYSGYTYEVSLESETDYSVTAVANAFRAAANCASVEGNRYVASNILTFTTRNDNPPTVDFFNEAGDPLCEKESTTCIRKKEVITLQFSDPVVKSSYDVNWVGEESYSMDNLPLNGNDLVSADNRYVELYEVVRTVVSGNVVWTRTGSNLTTEMVSLDPAHMKYQIRPKNDLKEETWYEIEFNKYTVKKESDDAKGVVFEGKVCHFWTGDFTKPALDKVTTTGSHVTTPWYAEQNVETDLDFIKIKFDEKITVAEGLTTKLRRLDGSIVAEFTSLNTRIDTVGKDNTALIFPLSEDLDEFTTFYMEMPAGFILDDNAACTKNAFGGLFAKLDPKTGELLSADYHFTTSDNTPPQLISVDNNDIDMDPLALFPQVGSTVAKNSDLSLIFDENIVIDATDADHGIVIYHSNGAPDADFGNAVEFIPWAEIDDAGSRISLVGTDIYNGVTSNKIVVNPNTEFANAGTYYVRVNGNTVKDGSLQNTWAQSTASQLDPIRDTEWYFGIANDVAPVLVMTDPAYDGVGSPLSYVEVVTDSTEFGYVKTDLTMTFYDNTVANGGQPLDVVAGDDLRMIRIFEYTYDPATAQFKSKPWITMPITDPSIEFVGNQVIVHDVVLKDGINGNSGNILTDSVYYVTVDAGAVLNGENETVSWWPGISNGFRWRFQTESDTVFVPGYEILSPNGETAVNLERKDADSLIVKFNEVVKASANPTGKVIVMNTDAEPDEVFAEITITDEMCKGNTLYIPVELEEETTYAVYIEAGAFGDGATVQNPNDMVADDEQYSWTFQVGDDTTPMAVVSPADADACVEANPVFTFTFDEVVTINDPLAISIEDANGPIEGVVIGEPVLEALTATSVITVEVTGLPDTTEIFVTVAEGFVLDTDELAHYPASAEMAYSFTTGDNTAPVATITVPTEEVMVDSTVITLTFSEPVNVADLTGVVTVNGVDITLTSTDSINYTGVVKVLASDMANEVVLAEGAFKDMGCAATGNEATTLTFDVADISAPEATYYPNLPGTAGDYMGIELKIVFDDAVVAKTGNVVIYNQETDEAVDTISVTDMTTTDDSTFIATSDKLYYGTYYALVDAGSFEDPSATELGKTYAGVTEKDGWVISIVDNEFADCANIITPEDDATGVATTTELVIEFACERIIAGSGNVYVGDLNTEAGDIVIAIVDSLISEDMHTLTIPVSGLKELTKYSVTIEPGAILDEAGNAFMGIVDPDYWNFTTADATEPVVSVVEATVNNYDGEAVITSSEAGSVYLVMSDVTPTVAAIEAAVAAGEAVTATATANVAVTVSTAGLPAGTYVAVAVDAAGNVGVSTETVVVVDVPSLTIAAIQGSAAASPYDGKLVQTKGIVTTVDKNGYYIQDASAEWSGIYVFDKVNAAIFEAGAAISVVGTVSEFKGLTEITAETVESILPFIKITPIVIPSTEALAEKYESVRVTVTGTAPAASGSDDVTLNNGYVVSLYAYLPGTYTWEEGYRYDVTGIVYENDGAYKVEPYVANDIVNASKRDDVDELVANVNVYPNPFNDHISIKVETLGVELTKAVITNMTGQIVKEVINPENNIATGELRNGVYFISLHTEDGVVKTQRMIKR